MKMKELERETGVGRETIRFYIREGLLPEPERPKRNVAAYGPEHVRRLKLIKRLQSERFLPLSIIKRVVEAEAALPAAGIDGFIGLENSLYPLLAEERALEERPVAEVIKANGISQADLDAWIEIGLIRTVEKDGTSWLDHRNTRIAQLMAGLRKAGFTDEAGFPATFWSLYVDMMKWLAHEEVVLFYQRAAGRWGQQEAAERGAAGIQAMNEILPVLRSEFVVREVEEISARGALEPDEAAAKLTGRKT